MTDIAVDTRELTRRFGPLTAVSQLTLQIRRGEVFGLLGPNGSGKTTSLKCVAGLLTPTRGSVRVPSKLVPSGAKLGFCNSFRIFAHPNEACATRICDADAGCNDGFFPGMAPMSKG